MLIKTNSQKGFTIIEVVITIAIGAAVMALVLNAVAGARRSQRNNARSSDISQLAGGINQYIANNNKLPDNFTDINQLVKLGHYTSAEINAIGSWKATVAPASHGDFEWVAEYKTASATGLKMSTLGVINTADNVVIAQKAKCGTSLATPVPNTLGDGGIREMAIAYFLEGQDTMNCIEV